jgi:acyl-CoA thioesterase
VAPHESQFDMDTAVTLLEPGVYDCAVSERHWVVAGPNGGYLAALLAKAAAAHLADPARQLRSLTVHYLRPPVAGPARIEVVTEQRGRSVTFLRLRMTQHDKQVLLAIGAWAIQRQGIEHDGWSMPAAPSPEACPPMTSAHPDGPLPVHRQWEIRSCRAPALGGGVPDLTWWIRPPVHRPLDGAMLVAIADACPPPIFATLTRPTAIPTLDLTVHVRAELAQVRWEPGDWILARFVTRLATGGFLEEDGELWAAGGTLLAHSRQLALAV